MRKHLLTTLLIPLFYVGFAIGYKPFDIIQTCDIGHFSPYAHIVLMGCIILCTLLISRTIYYLTEMITQQRFKWWEDIIWCLVEIIIAAFFMALYMCLFSHNSYFECLAMTLSFVLAICIYPYTILCLSEALIYNEQTIKYSKEPENVIRFHDENKRLKLVVASSAVLYIKADDNSVIINYLESGDVKSFSLRASMRSLEPIAAKFHLVRCQRSYYVNPAHVNILRKDNEGFIFAVLDIDGAKPIPVSKTYYDNLASIL